jgi:NADH pyrophosphatase NudC (nudix superfamily)
VAFYLFEYLSGDVADHDHEIEEARWMPLEEAAQALTYEGEREMVARALSRIASDR